MLKLPPKGKDQDFPRVLICDGDHAGCVLSAYIHNAYSCVGLTGLSGVSGHWAVSQCFIASPWRHNGVLVTSNDIAEGLQMTTGNTDEQSVMDSVFSKSSDMGAESAAPGAPLDIPAPEAAAPEPKLEDVITPADVPDEDEAPLQGRDPRTGKFVPVTELVAERKKLKGQVDAESRLRIEAEARAKVYEDQIKALQQIQHQPQRQAAPPVAQPQPPDPYLDPEGHAKYLQDNFEQRLIDERVNTSEMLARNKHGDAIVDQAINAAVQAGIAHRFQGARDPVGAVVQWHKKAQAQAEIGDDLEAFKKRVADEAVAKALAGLKATGTPQGQAQPAQRFPGTLADQTATGAQGSVISEATAINDVFSKERKRA